jgi:putative transposase
VRHASGPNCGTAAWCSRKRVARLLRLAGLQGYHRRKGPPPPRRTSGWPPASDLVRRDFAAPAPDRLWVADITSVPTWAGFLSLAVVLDAHRRRIVGWAMADHLRSELVIEAVDMAVW